jgi:hypothetical protein
LPEIFPLPTLLPCHFLAPDLFDGSCHLPYYVTNGLGRNRGCSIVVEVAFGENYAASWQGDAGDWRHGYGGWLAGGWHWPTIRPLCDSAVALLVVVEGENAGSTGAKLLRIHG